MQFSDETKERLLVRHCSLVRLAKYLEGEIATFLDFLKNVFLFEKNVETGKDPSYAQCSIFAQILGNASQFKKILFSQEWQMASEYFVLPHNASELLEIFYQLDFGSSCVEVASTELRQKLVAQAFSDAPKKGVTRYNKTLLNFVFSQEPAWSFPRIEWQIEEWQGAPHLVGSPIISLGMPTAEGPELYRDLYAFTGSEKKAASLLAIHALLMANATLQNTAKAILSKIETKDDPLGEWFTSAPEEWKKAFAQWKSRDFMDRQFSIAGLSFMLDALMYLERNQSPGYEAWKKHLESYGFRLEDTEQPCGYEFSSQVPQGNILRIRPSLQYYWPLTHRWETVLPGKCHFCAGPMPLFLQEIEKLAKLGLVQPRPEDLQVVKELFLYKECGDKVSKPPLLPVYNALRRWLDALAAKEDYSDLENVCELAKALRPDVQIPTLGEKPFSIAHREHKLIPRFAPEQKPGIIVGIKQAGIMIPADKMPLCLNGVYWIARQHSELDHFIETTSSLALQGEESFRQAWQNLSNEENVRDFLVVLQYVLKDMKSLPEEIWQTILKTVSSFNEAKTQKIICLPVRQITQEQFKEWEQNPQFRIKIAHTSKFEEGTILSQEPGLQHCGVVVASGIAPKVLQSLQNLSLFARERKGEAKTLDAVRCNLLSFARAEKCREEMKELLQFCESHDKEVGKKEDFKLLQKWLENEEKNLS